MIERKKYSEGTEKEIGIGFSPDYSDNLKNKGLFIFKLNSVV